MLTILSGSLNSKTCKCVLLLLIIFSAGVLLTMNITEKWVGNRDSCGALYGVIAKNYIKHGYMNTRFGMVTNKLPDGTFHYYINHPPVLPLLISLSYKLFGVHEWSTRLIPILFSLGSAILLFVFAQNIGGFSYGLLCMFLLVLSPMFSYFGRLPNFEPLVSFFLLACLIFYQKWLAHAELKSYIFMSIFLFIACMIDWPGYFLSILIILHSYATYKKISLPILSLLIINICAALFYLGHIIFLIGPTGISHMANQFLFRAGLSSIVGSPNPLSSTASLSFLDFIYLHTYRSILYFSSSIIILSLLWVLSFYRKRNRSENIIWCFFFVALLNICVFANASIYHDFWNFYFTYFFALSASFGFFILWSSGKINKKRIAVILLILFMGQSLWLLERRHAQNDGYPLDIPLANLLKENIPPDARAGSSLRLIPYFASFYADVSITPAVDTKEKFLSQAQSGRYGYFVTATPHGIRSNIPHYANAPPEEIDKLGALPDSSDLFLYLNKTYPAVEKNGFVFFKLK